MSSKKYLKYLEHYPKDIPWTIYSYILLIKRTGANSIYNNFLKDFIYLFLERGERREKEGERNINVWLPLTCPLLGIWLTTQAHALTGTQTDNPWVYRLALTPLSHTSQDWYYFLFDLKHAAFNVWMKYAYEIVALHILALSNYFWFCLSS